MTDDDGLPRCAVLSCFCMCQTSFTVIRARLFGLPVCSSIEGHAASMSSRRSSFNHSVNCGVLLAALLLGDCIQATHHGLAPGLSIGGMTVMRASISRPLSQVLKRVSELTPGNVGMEPSEGMGCRSGHMASATGSSRACAWVAVGTVKTGGEEDLGSELLALRPWPQNGKKMRFLKRALHMDHGALPPSAKGSKKQSKGADSSRWGDLRAAIDGAGHKVAAGFMSGLAQAGIFHPWDRALYLAQTNQRAFFNPANWQSPFQGIVQTLILRVTSATVFFPLEDSLSPITASVVGEGTLAHFLAGNAAGAINAFALNPVQTVRYRCFTILNGAGDKTKPPAFWGVARDLWSKGGGAAFFQGISPTVMRDLTFGGVFTAARMELASMMGVQKTEAGATTDPKDQSTLFACDMLAALLATTLSSPFNYARNLIYAHPAGLPPLSTQGILGELMLAASRQATPLQSAGLLQRELKIGVANLRVAVAMAMSSALYRIYYESLNEKGSKGKSK